MRQTKKLSILHVTSIMDRGGVETWLMHILRRIDRRVFAMDFLTQTTKAGHFDDEIRDLGSRVIPCLYPSRPWAYSANMKRCLQAAGPYDIVHSHLQHYNGFVMRLASAYGVPVRIAHSHNDTSAIDADASLVRKGYLRLSKRWIARFATCKVAASQQAGLSLFDTPGIRNQWSILQYGADLKPFMAPVDRASIRAELGIPIDAFVIGHVGRFAEQKNHQFFVRVAAEIASRDESAHFVLVGDGPLRRSIESQIAQSQLSHRFSLLGVRPDVPRILKAMDAFLFPSLHEGCPLALSEAQAAGLPCFFSDVIAEETDFVPSLVHRLSLGQPSSQWSDAVLSRSRYPGISRAEALKIIEKSAFNIEVALRGIEEVYRTATLVRHAA